MIEHLKDTLSTERCELHFYFSGFFFNSKTLNALFKKFGSDNANNRFWNLDIIDSYRNN